MNTISPLSPSFYTLIRKNPFSMPSPGSPLPLGMLVDEEISPAYDSKYFYPVKPREVLADRYQTLVKVGWGVSSTVWLARDLRGDIETPEKVVALKVANNNANLKLEKIMVSFEDLTVLADFIDSQLKKLISFKIDAVGRPVYQSYNNFGLLKSLRSIPQLVDFGLTSRLEEDND
ncbi:hypothetical protein N7527_001869 [Penicillium freii]|nr:hypothetical protein N7527_001869 [Penicillium freii]